MFLKNRHAKKIYKVGKGSRNTSNVKFMPVSVLSMTEIFVLQN